MITSLLVVAQLAAIGFPTRPDAVHERPAPTVLQAAEPFGRARVIIPALAIAYVGAYAVGGEDDSREIVRTAAGYFAADLVGGVLKIVVGRHRPDSTRDAWRFAPFSRGREWHSFPSGHTYHAFSIASAVADESSEDLVDVIAYGVAVLVGAQRIYSRAHWVSDVLAGVAVGISVSRYARGRVGFTDSDSEPASPTPVVVIRRRF